MRLNAKLITDDGVQVACFPSQQLYITQGEYTNFSHAGTRNVDNACSSNKRRLYAPVDMKCVAVSSSGYGLVLYQSTEKVLLANGQIDYLSMWLMHDNDYSRWQVGKVYKQGEWIYTEGDLDASGLTTGIHVHYEVAQGLHSQRVVGSGGYSHIVSQSHIDDIFFTNHTEVLRENASGSMKGTRTFNFKEYTGETGVDPSEPSEPSEKEKNIYHAFLSKAFPML